MAEENTLDTQAIERLQKIVCETQRVSFHPFTAF
jgi:hypothetical protein